MFDNEIKLSDVRGQTEPVKYGDVRDKTYIGEELT